MLPSAAQSGSTRTRPLNQSAGPAADACVPARMISTLAAGAACCAPALPAVAAITTVPYAASFHLFVITDGFSLVLLASLGVLRVASPSNRTLMKNVLARTA